MAQTPESSEYNGMPRSVIDTGLADYILSPKDMPAQLIAYVTQAFGKVLPPANEKEDSMNKIFSLIFNRTGHDFSRYKMGTITRRIERRMAVSGIEIISEYVRYLEQKPAEVNALFHDFLISVTSFFRNSNAFACFRKKLSLKSLRESIQAKR